MCVVAATSTDNEIRLLIDVCVVRVEVLTVVVVEHSWLSVVLHHDLAEVAHVLGRSLFVFVFHIALWTQPWVIVNSLFLSLCRILLILE
jgi:hypothetical protein